MSIQEAHSVSWPPKVAIPIQVFLRTGTLQMFSSPFGHPSRRLVSYLHMSYLPWHGGPYLHTPLEKVILAWKLKNWDGCQDPLEKVILPSKLKNRDGCQDPCLFCNLFLPLCKGLLHDQRGKLGDVFCGNCHTSRLYDRERTWISLWWVFCSRTNNNTSLHHHLVQWMPSGWKPDKTLASMWVFGFRSWAKITSVNSLVLAFLLLTCQGKNRQGKCQLKLNCNRQVISCSWAIQNISKLILRTTHFTLAWRRSSKTQLPSFNTSFSIKLLIHSPSPSVIDVPSIWGCFSPLKEKEENSKEISTPNDHGKSFSTKLCSIPWTNIQGYRQKPWIGAGSLGTGSGDLAIKRSFCSVFFRTKWLENHLFLKLKFRLSFLFPVLFQHNISKTKNPTSINHSIIHHSKRDDEIILLQTGSPNQVTSDSNWTIIIHLTRQPTVNSQPVKHGFW